jgi:alanine-glyoxylate transaminase/serine-glyoxylate transaminase/serine-pyruvate transaminase
MTQLVDHSEPQLDDRAAPLSMVVGPTRMAPSVRQRLSAPAPPLTDPGFIAEFGRCLVRFGEAVGSTTAELVVTPGSGTLAMEAVVLSLLRPGVPVLVASTGIWADRWRDICLRHQVPVHAPAFPLGRAPDLALIEDLLSRGQFQAVLVAQVDSSSGVRADIAGIAARATRYGALSLVDGVSALGAEHVEMDAWGVDVYLAGPSKALGASAGLAMYALGQRALALLRDRPAEPGTFALDLASWLPVMAATRRGEFGYFQSPASNLVLALSEALRLVLAEGRAERVARHEALRDRLHAGLADLGVGLLVPDPLARAYGMSVCVVPPDVRDDDLLTAVAAEGVVLQSGTLHPDGGRTFRIGHLGTVTDADIDTTLRALGAGLAACR